MDLQKHKEEVQTKMANASQQLQALENQKQSLLQELLRLDGEMRLLITLSAEVKDGQTNQEVAKAA